MNIVPVSQIKIKDIAAVLKYGGLIICPTDTVYGLLVDATNEKAVDKLIRFKNRPPGKPISVFVADWQMLKKTVEVNRSQKKLLESLLPGPFTIVLPSKHSVSQKLESEKRTLGIRLPDYSFITEIVGDYGGPLTSTSANLSGRRPHYSSHSILQEFPKSKMELVDLVIDGGELPRNKPSTIIDLTTPRVKILRQGDIVFSEKHSFLSKSANQTGKIGQFIFNKFKYILKEKPLVFILRGDLGSGKTVFVKGLGELLGVNNIISPTYVIYYEYPLRKKNTVLLHVDLYNITEDEEYKHLGLTRYLIPGNIICIEWGEKSKAIFGELKKRGEIIFIQLEYQSKDTRKIYVNSGA